MAPYDAIVIGAGPAGSTSAYRLAAAGASVLLVDRAAFPRDKPCGGGLTRRAVGELLFTPEPVVEAVVSRVRVRLRYGAEFERHAGEPLVLMTRRSRFDQFLVEQAVAAGAEFRDDVRVTDVVADSGGCTVALGTERERSAVVIGADGANGISRRAVGLAVDHGVALEANVPRPDGYGDAGATRLTIELGAVAGGYGWVFPKRDHLNVGVGGAPHEAARLREHLARLCSEHGLPTAGAGSVRGFRLPVRRPGAPLARGRLLLVGDAAGLIDPSSGDGIYEALLSARVAAAVAVDFLSGRAGALASYAAEIERRLRPVHSVSWDAKLALERFPRLLFALAGSQWGWGEIERTVAGDRQPPVGPWMRALLRLLAGAARRTGDPATPWRLGRRSLRSLASAHARSAPPGD